MEQYRTRPAGDAQHRGTPLPPQGQSPDALPGGGAAPSGEGAALTAEGAAPPGVGARPGMAARPHAARPHAPRTSAAAHPRGPRGPRSPRTKATAPRAAASPVARVVRGTIGAVRKVYVAVRTMPNPRLTGLGAGVFATAALLLVAWVDWLLLDGSAALYCVLFLPVCALAAHWVRPADLVMAPVVVPIAFALGLLPIAEAGGGFGGRLMGLLTALALNAGWLYGGTLIAGAIATIRKVRDIRRRRAAARAARRRTG
ncbi:DUF6542 domain-containing protein [Streptomyces sp. KLOTTS4A1]|uniref:DUF6542 domain-containing protein n=1 Tax=Streptomyces sp. KLOTTS4A1 TaxID=3390996 RepID=UPI0039F5CC02